MLANKDQLDRRTVDAIRFVLDEGRLALAPERVLSEVAYALALMAITRGPAFKRNAARWSGLVLIVLGGGIVAEAIRRGLQAHVTCAGLSRDVRCARS